MVVRGIEGFEQGYVDFHFRKMIQVECGDGMEHWRLEGGAW